MDPYLGLPPHSTAAHEDIRELRVRNCDSVEIWRVSRPARDGLAVRRAVMQGLHTRPRRAWDHRIRENTCRTRNPNLYPELGIPRSTAATWLIRDCPEVVTLEPADDDAVALREQLQRLEKLVRRLIAVIRLQRGWRRPRLESTQRSRRSASEPPDPTSRSCAERTANTNIGAD